LPLALKRPQPGLTKVRKLPSDYTLIKPHKAPKT
jgi:hypothetical protein